MPTQLMDPENEYAKDKNLKREDIKTFAEWLQKQPHLPKATELQLILFLQACYYRLEPAKTALDNFFTIRTLCPDIFGTPNIETLKQQLSVGYYIHRNPQYPVRVSINVLPGKTPEGYTVVFMKLIDPNPDNYHCVSQLNFSDLSLMLNLHQGGTSNGILTVFDLKGLAFGHLTKFNLMALKKHLFYVQEAAPIRIKGIHYINVVPFMDKVMGLVKPFMKKELLDLLTFHTESLESLYKFIPKEILPQDYGGQAPPLALLHEQNSRNLLNNMDFFKWMDSLKVDEGRRPGKPKSAGDFFGVDGTFKKLEVD